MGEHLTIEQLAVGGERQEDGSVYIYTHTDVWEAADPSLTGGVWDAQDELYTGDVTLHVVDGVVTEYCCGHDDGNATWMPTL